jgi:hypothetical protein
MTLNVHEHPGDTSTVSSESWEWSRPMPDMTLNFCDRMRSEISDIMAAADDIVPSRAPGPKSSTTNRNMKSFKLRTIDEFINDELKVSKTAPAIRTPSQVVVQKLSPIIPALGKNRAQGIGNITPSSQRKTIARTLTKTITTEERNQPMSERVISSRVSPQTPRPVTSSTVQARFQPGKSSTSRLARPQQNKWIKIEDLYLPL